MIYDVTRKLSRKPKIDTFVLCPELRPLFTLRRGEQQEAACKRKQSDRKRAKIRQTEKKAAHENYRTYTTTAVVQAPCEKEMQ